MNRLLRFQRAALRADLRSPDVSNVAIQNVCIPPVRLPSGRSQRDDSDGMAAARAEVPFDGIEMSSYKGSRRILEQ